MPTVSELALATYCRRKLHHRREEGWDPPTHDGPSPRALAGRYEDLLERRVPATHLAADPGTVADRLRHVREREPGVWGALRDGRPDPVHLTGRDCRGRADRVLEFDPPVPTTVRGGTPPRDGVWAADGVRATALGAALAWERDRPVERAVVEYPRAGAVRVVALTGRRRAVYRRALRAVRTLEDPPPRTDDDAKCRSCEYRERCGVRSRSLRSLLP